MPNSAADEWFHTAATLGLDLDYSEARRLASGDPVVPGLAAFLEAPGRDIRLVQE